MSKFKKDRFGNNSALTLISNLTLVLLFASTFFLKIPSAGGFDLNAEMDECAQIYRIPRLSDKRRGFDFGFGSLNDTEFMCRTRYHIKIIQCVKEHWEATSDMPSEPDFLKVVWAHTLNTKRYERAAAYICRQHNLRIFRQHKNACLREAEASAESCSKQTDESIQEVVGALKNQSFSAVLGLVGDSYQQNLKKIMHIYECKAMRKKLDCLYALLSSHCPADAVQLIMNYFIESLPTGCHYHYQSPSEANSELTKAAVSTPSAMQGDDGNPSRPGQPLPLHLSGTLSYPPVPLSSNYCGRSIGSLISVFLLDSWLLRLID